MKCTYGGICGGCPLIETEYSEQKNLKLKHFHEHWKVRELPDLPHVNFVMVAESGLRDRADLTWHIDKGKKRLGLYDKDRNEILDLESCPQMSEALAGWHKEVRNIKFPVELGSLRLRVGPTGLKGIWLDFSNVNVKELFDEQQTLLQLLDMGVVEVGQRRKRLFYDGERLRLTDPKGEHWFQTFVGAELRPVPLECSIADFTQPSMKANRMMMGELGNMLRGQNLGRLFEFGSGIGNFTLPLAELSESVDVFERDKYSLIHLKNNLKTAKLTSKVNINAGDYQRIKNKPAPDFTKADSVFADPPRSGLKEFLTSMKDQSKRPRHFIYVSCFAESFCEDSKTLYDLGYKIKKINMIDQFPQSHHYELMAHFVHE